MPEGRTQCSVPFCPRFIRGLYYFHLCHDHWQLVDRSLKLACTRVFKRYVRLGEASEGPRWRRWHSDRAWRAGRGFYRRMIRQATERAAGITA